MIIQILCIKIPMLFPLESNLFPHFAVETVLLLSSPYWTFNCYAKTAHGLVRETGLVTYILRYSDFIASRQRFRRFKQMKRKWWFREGGSNIQLQSQSLLFYLILNYPEIYIYFYILLFPTNIV